MSDEKLQKLISDLQSMHHDTLVGMQAAWIEWKHGRGADAAMRWIENALDGPGLIPRDDEPWVTEAQAYYDSHKSDPFPQCFCGRPSNQLWLGMGFCSHEHYRQVRERAQ